MELKIISVHNSGDYEKEYVLMRAQEDCNVGHFLLSDTTYTSENEVSDKLRHIFWIPDRVVNKGELISVWTKAGRNTTTTSTNNTILHRFYWGLETAVWNDSGDCAVLFDIRDWQVFPAE